MKNAIASYEGRTCTDPQDIRIAIKNIEYVKTSTPLKQEDIGGNITKLLVGKELDMYVKRRQLYCKNNGTLYSVVLVQCT